MRKIVVISATLGVLALAGCVEENTTGIAQPLESCGKVVTSRGASYTEAPILNEGGGKIGIGTQQQSGDQIHQRYSLVDCASKSITRVEQNWALSNAPTSTAQTVEGMVNSLRAAGRLTASGQLARGGRDQGFQVTEGRVDAVNNERAACGCQMYYPDLLWQ